MGSVLSICIFLFSLFRAFSLKCTKKAAVNPAALKIIYAIFTVYIFKVPKLCHLQGGADIGNIIQNTSQDG